MKRIHFDFDVATFICMSIIVLALVAGVICALVQMRFVCALVYALMCVYAFYVTCSLLNEKD